MSAPKPMPCKSTAAHHLPCLGTDGLCYGPVAWDKQRGVRLQVCKNMGACPWTERVRSWFKREMETGRIKRDW